MKGICVFKRLLFINVLCLLWLPNFCDIKHNEADDQGIQADKILSGNVRTENVSPEQEKEIYQKQLDINLKEELPNVDYVNNLEIEEVNENLESLQKNSSENKQQITKNLDSSRINDADFPEESALKHKSISETSNAFTETSNSPKLKLSDDQKTTIEPHKIQASETQVAPEENVKLVEEVKVTISPDIVEKGSSSKVVPVSPVHAKSSKPVTEENVHHQPHYDGMPSFDEWKKMMLAEQEKGGQKLPSPTPPGKKISSQKRRRNYSSFECGAKIVASNSEAEGTSRILNELVDDYMLNPCKAKIWFVIELCETVQATQIELANFELFSSCPKDFIVYSSDNFPTRDWVTLGAFTAAEQRVLQSFELKQEGFGKFIKIELLSHYGTEHYCPLSVVRIFGTSMVDEYEEMETLASHVEISEDDLDRLDIVIEDKKPTNIFGSATDAVMNIVKKAAQALGQHSPVEEGKNNETVQEQQNLSESKLCTVDDSIRNKCQDVPIKHKSDTHSSLLKFPIPSSSMHHSLFHLLHRCDQCVSSRIRYYSSAQPQCRFFQAALGPVVFQTLCDWFKEHPVVIAQESSSHSNKVSLGKNNLNISPTKSPPPQVMRVAYENDIPWKKLISNDTIVTLGPISASDILNATKLHSNEIVNNTTIKEVTVELPILPTATHQVVITTTYNESKSTALPAEVNKSVSMSNVDQESPSKVSIVAAVGTSIPVDIISETSFPGGMEASIINDGFTDSEMEQMRDLISEDLPSDTIAVTESPTDLKPSEDKLSDVQTEFQVKEAISVSGGSTAGQKESVFMRMSNRIKALEINMSLSSQYLQELSQRYRRQMEEMQRAFNRTIGTLNDTARKAAEKDSKQQDVLNNLQLQVANLTETVELLLSERSSIFRKMIETHVCLMVIEAIVMITIMSLCVRRISSSAGQIPPSVKETVVVSPRLAKRRSSVDSCTPPVARKVKKRSASEEALNAGEELLIIEPLPVLIDPILKAKKKNRKRNKAIQRSNSNPSDPRRNSNSTSQHSVKRTSRSDGSMQSSVRSKMQPYVASNGCENCNDNMCTVLKLPEKERRHNGAPFQNLTNGSVISPYESHSNNKLTKGKERFSFKKFLKLQKRDSI